MKNQALLFKYDDLKLEGEHIMGELPLELCRDALAEIVGSLGYWVERPVSVSGMIYRTPSGEVIVDAKLKGEADFKCVSCALRQTWTIEIREDLIVVPKTHSTAQEDNVEGEGDLEVSPDLYVFEGHEFDLSDILREVLVLNSMGHPRCEDVGQECGPSLANIGSDEVPEQPEIDPRWAPLLAMQEALQNKEDTDHEDEQESGH
jgi:uncharacterized metal-binding protein YceD (DUF177 family)